MLQFSSRLGYPSFYFSQAALFPIYLTFGHTFIKLIIPPKNACNPYLLIIPILVINIFFYSILPTNFPPYFILLLDKYYFYRSFCLNSLNNSIIFQQQCLFSSLYSTTLNFCRLISFNCSDAPLTPPHTVGMIHKLPADTALCSTESSVFLSLSNQSLYNFLLIYLLTSLFRIYLSKPTPYAYSSNSYLRQELF